MNSAVAYGQTTLDASIRSRFVKTVTGLEVHVLDWEGDLYGKRITVQFINKIREERQFANVDELIVNIQADIAKAKQYFADLRRAPGEVTPANP